MSRLTTLIASTTFAGLCAAQTLVVPSAAAAADGNSSSGWPFDVAAARLLYIYDSSHFTNNGVNFPILINQISWRANGATATWTGSSGTVQLDLSTAPIDQTAISTTWNSNHGADRATVYNGPLTIAAGTSAAGAPGPFHVTLSLAAPFLYDPTQGDLTIDTTHSGLTIANTPTMDLVNTAGVALARRVYSIANPPAATATLWSGEAASVLEFTYTPAAGLYAGFAANVTSGTSPLAVNFTDLSSSSAPGGIVSWAWDFDGDAVVDSTLQNPTHVYAACGNYTVSLTVTDGVNPPSTLTRAAYVRTDDLVASFTTQVIGALQVQFTDTSVPAATAWDWDFNGDNVTDSTLPNPVWVFPNTAPTNVRLTAQRLCKSNTVTQSVIAAQQLPANNGGTTILSAGATYYMDLQVTNPSGVNIGALDIFASTTNLPFSIDFFLKQGSYVGSELVPAAWTLVAQAAGTAAASTATPSLATLTQVLHVPQGNYGLALRYLGVGPRYNTATSLVTFGNADLAIVTGASAATYTTAFTSTSAVITPRTWAGTIYYGTHNVTGQAGHGFFGPGCAGTLPASHQNYVTAPQLGGTLSVACDNLPFGIGVMVVGASNTLSAFGPLPVDLGFVGAPGCALRVSTDVTDTLVGAGTAATWNLAIPATPTLSGLLVYNQLAVLDPAANAFGFVVGDAAGWVLGN